MNRDLINNVVFYVVSVAAAVFIIMKLANVIDWPWLIVLSPFWGVALLYLFIYIICRVGLSPKMEIIRLTKAIL